MIDALLGELGRRLTDRWLTRAVGPGLLWCAIAAYAIAPARRSTFDVHGAVLAAAKGLDHLIHQVSLGVVCGLLTVAVAAAAAAVATGAGALARFVWLGRWPGPSRPLATLLTTRRRAAAERRLAARRRALPAVYLPDRPTWIADRIRLTEDRVAAQYGLRLGLIWPRLWLLLAPEDRIHVTQARDRFDRSGDVAGWALLYAVLALWWWPAVLAGVLLAVIAWWRARTSAALFADVVEATVDLRHRALVTELGFAVAPGHPLDPATADAINDLLHKGGSGYEQVPSLPVPQPVPPSAPPPAPPSAPKESRASPVEPRTQEA
ncbi:hypothetical protein [Actinoplanes sp. NPDC051851]|uniref:hypothetical protein n=1 Tax=Actinoplanes sp. NPDC051851 TaxID=3154753 RepID=UPI00342934BA